MEGIFAPWHIASVLDIALLIFGPKRLPGLGNSLGKSISGFQKGMKEASEEFTSAVKEAKETAPAAEAAPVSQPAESAVASAVLPEPAAEQTPVAESTEPAAKV